MKKHILSNYLKQVKKLVIPSKDDTIVTESMETSDIDEFRYDRGENVHDSDGTLTHSIETSDPDEFKLDITGETRSIETSDPDNFFILDNSYYDNTQTTFSVEQGDMDEFALL